MELLPFGKILYSEGKLMREIWTHVSALTTNPKHPHDIVNRIKNLVEIDAKFENNTIYVDSECTGEQYAKAVQIQTEYIETYIENPKFITKELNTRTNFMYETEIVKENISSIRFQLKPLLTDSKCDEILSKISSLLFDFQMELVKEPF